MIPRFSRVQRQSVGRFFRLSGPRYLQAIGRPFGVVQTCSANFSWKSWDTPCYSRWAWCRSIPSSFTISHSTSRYRRAMSLRPSNPCLVIRMRLSAPKSTKSCRCIRRIIPATDVPSPSVFGQLSQSVGELGDGGNLIVLSQLERHRR